MRTLRGIGAVVAASVAAGGCLQILGYQDPTLDVPEAGSGGAGTTSTSSPSSTASGTGGMGGSCPMTLCAGVCVDTESDAKNCGGCGNTCPAGASCMSGKCVCPGNETLCTKMCVDMSHDASNCGACGHNCQGGMCVASMCQPVILASGQNSPQDIAVDGTSVYWVNFGTVTNNNKDGTVMKVPIAGGTPMQLAGGQTMPRRLVVDATSVYWTASNSTGTVMKVPLGGGATTQLASAQGSPWGVAVDATSVYWTNWGGGTVMKVPLSGGAATQLASGQRPCRWPSFSSRSAWHRKVSLTKVISIRCHPSLAVSG